MRRVNIVNGIILFSVCTELVQVVWACLHKSRCAWSAKLPIFSLQEAEAARTAQLQQQQQQQQLADQQRKQQVQSGML